MKEYKSVTNEIHAPKELIEKTKAAVKEEEKRVMERRKNIVVFQKGMTAAAAVLIAAIIIVPVVRMRTGMLPEDRTEIGDEWQEETVGKLMLGEEKEKPEKLGSNRTVIERGAWNEKPQGVAAELTYEINGVTVFMYKEQEGRVAAEFVCNGTTYSAVNENGSEEQLLEDIEEYLNDF